jgi:hypothetical protein
MLARYPRPRYPKVSRVPEPQPYLAVSTLVLFLVLSTLGFSTLVIPLAPVEC